MESIEDILKRNGIQPFQTILKTSSNADNRPKTDICPLCDGMGFILPDVWPEDPRFGRSVPCSCKRGEIDEKRAENLVKLSQLGALKSKTFEAFNQAGVGLSAEKSQNLTTAYNFAQTFALKPQGWLLLQGSYGCGKTHLAAAVANYQLELGRPVLFVNTPDLLDHLRGTYRPGNGISYDERFEQIRNTPLLILDDLGAHNTSEWAQEKLYQIFNHRYNAALPTIITTNQDLELIDIRLRSRMSDQRIVKMIKITAPDFRRGGVYQEESDLSTLHLHSTQTFGSFDLRHDELQRKQTLNLKKAFNMMKEFADYPNGWIILNSSNYGNGKTHLAAAVANAVSDKGNSVLFIVVPDLLDHLRATFDPRVGARLDTRFNQVKTAKLLILDDLGTESATAWAREKLYQLFNYRYNAQLPTIITTTTPIDKIDERLSTRFMDERRCTFFFMETPSYRGKQKKSKRPAQQWESDPFR